MSGSDGLDMVQEVELEYSQIGGAGAGMVKAAVGGLFTKISACLRRLFEESRVQREQLTAALARIAALESERGKDGN